MTPRNLGELLSLSAQKYPRRVAIVFGQRKIRYKELDELTDKIACGLIHLGIKPGDKAALFLDNCPEFIIAYYALLKAGGVVVPINYMFKMEEAKFILQDCQATALITSRAYLETAQELRLRVDSLAHIIATAKAGQHILDLHNIKRDNLAALKKIMPGAHDPAVILYTSGTTGHPKGAILSHANLISNARDCQLNMKVSCKDTIICILPLFHSFAATVCMNLPLLAGAKTVVMKSVKPFKRVVRAVRRNRVTLFVGIPSIFTVLKNIKMPRIFHSPLIRLFNPVKLCVSGAAALPVETFKAFERKFRIPLLEGYGLTEAAPVVTINPLKGRRKPGSIGRRLSESIELRIVDEKDREVRTGQIGELLVKGPNVMQGYLKQEEATCQTLKDGWLYTGDMAKIDSEGYVYIAGRKKEMINVRGLNVYPRELEEVLYQNPKVKECAVIGVADEHKGEVPKGFVVLKEGEESTQRELLDYMRRHLASFKTPKFIEFRDSLPKNSTGKILKRLLQEEENGKRKTG